MNLLYENAEKVFLSDVIGKGFYNVYTDFMNGRHTHYFLGGGITPLCLESMRIK